VFSALTGIFACVYAFVRHRNKLSNRIFFKTAASVMFVLVAVSLQTGAKEPYFTLILVGLCFALVGDVLLIFTDRSSSFLAWGMVCFLITHLLYIAALFSKAALSIYDIAFFAALIVIAAAFFSLRGVRFKKLHPAVYVYAVVLCAMAARSLSVSFSSQVSETFAVIIALGGVLFLISDVLLAIESFGGRLAKTVGMLSTFTYYASQILIALSVAM
jgi:uncharacterized membrane protein YhhN